MSQSAEVSLEWFQSRSAAFRMKPKIIHLYLLLAFQDSLHSINDLSMHILR